MVYERMSQYQFYVLFITCLFCIHTKVTECKTQLYINECVTECSAVPSKFYRCQGTHI